MNIHSAITKGPKKEILQDALSIVNKQDYTLIIIADGLGSAKHSDYGAKKAVIAVEKAINEWRKLKRQDVKILIKLIKCFWNLFINDSDYNKNECATTCLFSFIDKLDNKILLGQLGDGLIFFETDSNVTILKSDIDYNYTKSLVNSSDIEDWNISSCKLNNKDFKLMITTDGISEDIVEDKEKEFAEKLIYDLSKIKKNKRNKHLNNVIDNWPTELHSDDKTICIVWEMRK